jgi:beta-phosphoglucomutase-like phosphatase (HAD superfamily)
MPALVFDLDGTLVDSAYEHVAWSDALRSEGILLAHIEDLGIPGQ